MNLFCLRGINCYHSAIITIADSMNIAYREAFAALWSETDFRYDPKHDLCLTRRLIQDLEAMGMKLMDSGTVPRGGMLLVGMDAFHIPWSPVYQALHDPHYFIVHLEGQDGICFDPTYFKRSLPISRRDIEAHAYEVLRVERARPTFLKPVVEAEARAVLKGHPLALDEFLFQIGENPGALGKRAAAMISNRHLFKYYLDAELPGNAFFGAPFFSAWTAFKNGLYKAALMADNRDVARELSALIRKLIDEEMSAAEAIADH